MYPLNVSLPAPAIGFAVANDQAEHQALTAAGYVPALAAPEAKPTRAELLAEAEARGVKVDARWSDKRLTEEIGRALV